MSKNSIKKVIIVDENDHEIGAKKRTEMTAEDMYRVAALWITDARGGILLAKRSNEKSHDPGKWGPAVAGTVEAGETYDDNIIKETEEELGIKLENLRQGPKIEIYGEYHYFCQWYFMQIDKPLKKYRLQKSEVAEVRWFKKEELIQELKNQPELFLPSMAQFINSFF
ncbi:MAG: NUDIX domain-containing protein [Patescibacteria group bacterium]